MANRIKSITVEIGGDTTKLSMELDEKYASVILRQYVEDTGNAEGVYVIRNGQQIPYSDLVKEVETKEG